MPDIKKLKLFEIVALTAVLLLGAFLYSYKIDQIPSGLYVDEASTGYNAYSLLTTGKDEYGKSYPSAMRFFGSYSPPLYTYLTMGAISFFGLNILSARFVSIVSGILSVLVFYLLLKNLKPEKSKATLILATLFFVLGFWKCRMRSFPKSLSASSNASSGLPILCSHFNGRRP